MAPAGQVEVLAAHAERFERDGWVDGPPVLPRKREYRRITEQRRPS